MKKKDIKNHSITFEEFTEELTEKEKEIIQELVPFKKETSEEIIKRIKQLSDDQQEILASIFSNKLKINSHKKRAESISKLKDIISHIALGVVIGTILTILFVLCSIAI